MRTTDHSPTALSMQRVQLVQRRGARPDAANATTTPETAADGGGACVLPDPSLAPRRRRGGELWSSRGDPVPRAPTPTHPDGPTLPHGATRRLPPSAIAAWGGGVGAASGAISLACVCCTPTSPPAPPLIRSTGGPFTSASQGGVTPQTTTASAVRGGNPLTTSCLQTRQRRLQERRDTQGADAAQPPAARGRRRRRTETWLAGGGDRRSATARVAGCVTGGVCSSAERQPDVACWSGWRGAAASETAAAEAALGGALPQLATHHTSRGGRLSATGASLHGRRCSRL